MKLWILQVWAKKYRKMIYAGWTQVLSEISKKMSGAKHSPTFLEVRPPFGAFWTLSRKYMMSSWVSSDLTEMCVSNRQSRRLQVRVIDKALNSASMSQKAWKNDLRRMNASAFWNIEKMSGAKHSPTFLEVRRPFGAFWTLSRKYMMSSEFQVIWLKCVFPTGKAEDRKLDW